MVSGWQHPFLKPLPPALPALLHALAGSPVADQPAVEDRHSAPTFRELDQRARGLAALLLEQGVHAGDTVVLTDRPGVGLSTAYMAVGLLGARVLHVHALLRPADIAHVTSLVRPKAVLGPPLDGLPSLPRLHVESARDAGPDAPLPAGPDPDQVLQYRLTSGSTGRPKVIPLTHRQLLRRAAAPGAWYTPGRRHGCAHAHLFPGYQVLTALAAGGTVVFEPLHAASPLEEFLRDRRIEWLWGSPALFALVARQKQPLADPLPALQAAVSSGAMLEPECADAVRRRWGVPVWQGYGQSELGFLTESGPGSAPDSAGRAVPGVILRVVDEAGLPLPCGREGRILARLEHPFPGYLGGEPSPVGADGWIATGDLGRLDAAGDLQVSGRDTDQIQVAGNKVFAREVEAVIRACPGVADATVFSLPHPLWGEVVAAAVVARAEPPPARREVLRSCRDRLQAWKCPRQLLFLPELPRTALGKVDLPRLRDLLGAAPS